MSYNPTVRWQKSTAQNVNQYDVAWTLNGGPALSGIAPQNGASDGAGYIRSFSQDNPLVVLHGNDVVGVSVTAVDTVNNLSSSAVSPASVTIPAVAPTPPVNVTLALN